MNRSHLFTCLALAAAAVIPAAAQDRYPRGDYPGNAYGYGNQYNYDRSYDNGYGYRDQRGRGHDWRRIERLRADIARDQSRLDENLRCGRRGAAARDARDLARDQRALAYLLGDRRWERDWR